MHLGCGLQASSWAQQEKDKQRRSTPFAAVGKGQMVNPPRKNFNRKDIRNTLSLDRTTNSCTVVGIHTVKNTASIHPIGGRRKGTNGKYHNFITCDLFIIWKSQNFKARVSTHNTFAFKTRKGTNGVSTNGDHCNFHVF